MPLLSLGTWQSCALYSQRHKLPLIPALWWQDLFSSRISRAKIKRTRLKNRTNSHFSVHIDLKMPGVSLDSVISTEPRSQGFGPFSKKGKRESRRV